MKKILGIITLIFSATIMIVGNNVYADTFGFQVYCNELTTYETYPGDIINCDISGVGNTDEKFNSIKISYESNDAFEYVTFDHNELVNEVTKNNTELTLKSKSGISATSNYGTIYFKISEDYSGESTLKISVGANSLEEEVYFDVNVSESNRENHGVTYLSDIKIEGYTLNFEKSKFDYKLKIKDEDSLKINPIVEEDEDWKRYYKIIGNENLEMGSVIYITTSTQGGETSIYSIAVEKEEIQNTPTNNESNTENPEDTTTNDEINNEEDSDNIIQNDDTNNETNSESSKEVIDNNTLIIVLVAANIILMIAVIVLLVSISKKSKKQNNNL